MTAPVLAAASAYRVKPYISVDMFKYHGRQGVDTQLVSKGMPDEQDVALAEQILEASAWMDTQILQGTLAAHEVTQVGFVNVSNHGYAVIQAQSLPIIGLTAASLGGSQQSMAALASLVGVGIVGDQISLPIAAWPLTSTAGPLQFANVAAPMDQARYQLDLVAGYPVAYLAQSVAAGAMSIDVDDTTGIVAGQSQLRIYAQNMTFTFIPTAVSTATPTNPLGTGPGTLTLPLALPRDLTNNADFPTQVSALPPDVIRCCKLATRSFIKSSGGGNVTMSAAQQKSPDPFGAGGDLAAAYQILTSYGAVQ